jgi:hypothetical protein
VLRGIELPAGQTPDGDVRAVIRNVFLHPNVGPFIGRQLIRHLVTGTPTPGVRRPRRRGVRQRRHRHARQPEGGRARDPARPRGAHRGRRERAYGRFREPALYVTAVLRGIGTASDGIFLDEVTQAMGQNVFYAPSVFNYFPAEYRIPGTDIVAPPMGVHNTNTVLARSNFVFEMLYDGGIDRDDEIATSIGTKRAAAAVGRARRRSRKLLGRHRRCASSAARCRPASRARSTTRSADRERERARAHGAVPRDDRVPVPGEPLTWRAASTLRRKLLLTAGGLTASGLVPRLSSFALPQASAQAATGLPGAGLRVPVRRRRQQRHGRAARRLRPYQAVRRGSGMGLAQNELVPITPTSPGRASACTRSSDNLAPLFAQKKLAVVCNVGRCSLR